MSLKKELANYRAEMAKVATLRQKVIDEVVKQIHDIEENGYVKTISNNPTIFTVKLSQLSSESWDPSYYNNKKLGTKLIEKISGISDLEKLIATLENVAKTKQFEVGKEKYRCNDNFVAAINKVLQTLQ